jgi:hydroxymethylbilane synthase
VTAAPLPERELVVGTRGSALARWQTDHVIDRLSARHASLRCRIEVVSTHGDRVVDRPLPEIGGQGVFAEELERRLLEGRIDFAVHSLKDLPVEPRADLAIPAILSRADVRDVLVARSRSGLDDLPAAAVVGSSSLRRQAQLLARRPDLEVRPIRGNVETRIAKVDSGEYYATVLAAAGVLRLGLEDRVTEWLPIDVMLPAPGQGALAVQCRSDAGAVVELLAALDDREVRAAVESERAFLHHLGGGCATPVGALAFVDETDVTTLRLRGIVAAPDGRSQVRVEGVGRDPEELGQRLAREALAQGAGRLFGA